MRSVLSDVADASTLELVEAAALIAAELARRDAPEPGLVALECAESLGRVVDVLECALAGLVGRVDDTGAFAELGFSSTGAWLRGRLGMRDGRAADRVRLARQLPRLRQVSRGLADGSISAGYAGAIADAVARLDDVDAELGERLLLGLVEEGHTAGQVARDAAQITDLINTHRGKEKEPEDSKRGFHRSWVTKSESLDGGLWLRAWLTPEHAATFDQIIGPLAKPKAKGDDRDLGQRTADALMSVVSEGNKGAGVTVIIDLAAFTQATGDTGPMGLTGHARDAKADRDPADGDRRARPTGPATGTAPDLASDAGSDADQGTNGRSENRHGRDQAHDQAYGETCDQAQDRPCAAGPRGAGDPGEDIDARDQRAGMADLGGMWDDSIDTGDGSADPPCGPADAQADTTGPPGTPDLPHPPDSVDISGLHSLDSLDVADLPGLRDSRDRATGWPGGSEDGGTTSTACAEQRGRRRIAARLLNGVPISPERARQIALNAGINVLILGRSGLPLYLGRTVRFATPAQRKALLALYETCCVQGCQIPAHLCEIHHLDGGWKLATATDIDKLAPACGWHNRWVETHPDQVEQTRDAHGRATLRLLAPWERNAMKAA